VHLEEIQMPKETVLFQTNARGVAAGRLFTLKSCPRKDLNREYMIVATSFYIRDNPYHSGGEGGGSQWRFGVTAQPTSLPYRPLRITPKPLTSGPQTAVVVGPSGEEIHTDKYGRVRVLFHWDQRTPQGDRGNIPYVEDASCWMRVSQPWAGTKFGVVFLPRVGQEVIVDFIGRPDQPIITGRVPTRPRRGTCRVQTQSGVLALDEEGAQLDANMILEDQKGRRYPRSRSEIWSPSSKRTGASKS
jgi:type VI secretion system secreted protein VgrG